MQNEWCTQLALGKFDDSTVMIVTNADDVLGNESNVGTTGGLPENRRVVIPLSDPVVKTLARLRCAVPTAESADGLPPGEPNFQLIPISVAQVGERCVPWSPECPGSVVADLEVAVDDDDVAVFVGTMHDLPQCTQPSTTRSGNDQISIEGGHGLDL